MYLHELFTEFILISGYDPKNFCEVALDIQLLAKKIVGRNLFINDFDIQEGKYVVELAQSSLETIDRNGQVSSRRVRQWGGGLQTPMY